MRKIGLFLYVFTSRLMEIVGITDFVSKKYENSLRKRLHNDKFTILSPTCVGGIIYHRLGKQFLSPTVNLWMSLPDFLRFCSHLSDYVQAELHFVHTEYDFPVADLKDVRIYFNHSKTENEAKEDWDRRKQRINYENIYIIMYANSSIKDEELTVLKDIRCKKWIVLSDHAIPGMKEAYYIRPNRIHPYHTQQYLDKDVFGWRTVEKKWDFVSWLND